MPGGAGAGIDGGESGGVDAGEVDPAHGHAEELAVPREMFDHGHPPCVPPATPVRYCAWSCDLTGGRPLGGHVERATVRLPHPGRRRAWRGRIRGRGRDAAMSPEHVQESEPRLQRGLDRRLVSLSALPRRQSAGRDDGSISLRRQRLRPRAAPVDGTMGRGSARPDRGGPGRSPTPTWSPTVARSSSSARPVTTARTSASPTTTSWPVVVSSVSWQSKLAPDVGGVTSGRGVWADTDTVPQGHPGVNGEYFRNAAGFVFGGPHFALYRREVIDEVTARWNVRFDSPGPDLGEAGPATSGGARPRVLDLRHGQADQRVSPSRRVPVGPRGAPPPAPRGRDVALPVTPRSQHG